LDFSEANCLDRLLSQPINRLSSVDIEELFKVSARQPLHGILFDTEADNGREILEKRLTSWSRIMTSIETRAPLEGRVFAPSVLWTYPCAFAQIIERTQAKICGIAGPPAAGKTTLAKVTSACLSALFPEKKFLQMSLDDFYFSKHIREAKGVLWRAQPGSHDLEKARQVLTAVQNDEQSIRISRFDPIHDEIIEFDWDSGPVSVMLLDGWFVGKSDQGYGAISKHHDYLTYLDCPVDLAKRRRFAREDYIRAQSGGRGGMSIVEMQKFWEKVLEPGIQSWVWPLKAKSDLIISLGSDGQVIGAQRRSYARSIEVARKDPH